MNAAVLPSAERIRDLADEILRRPEYELVTSSPKYEGLLVALLKLLKRIFSPLAEAFRALSGISPALAWVITIVLAVILAALIFHIVCSIRQAFRPHVPAILPETGAQPVFSAAEFEKRARKAAGAQDHLSAIRCVLLAGLITLDEAQDRPFQRAATNRQYLRRFRGTRPFEPLKFLVELIESRWYGEAPCCASDYEASLQALDRIKASAREPGAKRA